MDNSMAAGLAGISFFVMACVFLLAVLWILVPFAIFGIKPLLRQLLGRLIAVERQNAELIATLKALKDAPRAERASDPPALP